MTDYEDVTNVALYTVNQFGDGFVDEVHERISSIAYGWVIFTSRTLIENLEKEAIYSLREKALSDGCDAIIDVKTSINFFPGFLMFRGCAVHVSGTPVTMSKD